MINETSIWLILALPVASFAVLGVLRPVIGPQSKYAGWLTIAAVAGSFVISVVALASVMTDGTVHFPSRDWISVGGFTVAFGLMLDPLTAIMLVTVSGVSLLVQIYSQAYIHGDRSYTRYYIFMSLFTASMLGLVTARNVVQLFVFWELVGISSYLLIGFWMDRPSAAAAAKKAFIMTRFADFGFLLGILYLYTQNPAWLDIPALYDAVAAGVVAVTAATWISLGVLHGRGRKVGPVPPALLAARCHGRSDAGFGPDPLRHHGDGGRISRGPVLPAFRSVGRHDGRRAHWRNHGRLRSDYGSGCQRHQTSPGIFDRQPTRVHDVRPRHRRLRTRDVPPVYTRMVQGRFVPGFGLSESRPPARSTCAIWEGSGNTCPGRIGAW